MPRSKPRTPPSPAFIPLPGSARELLPHSRPAGPIDPTEIVSLSIRTRSAGDLDALEREVKKLYTVPLKQRAYLSREQLVERYGARRDDLDRLEDYVQKQNLVVTRRSPAERLLVVTGKLSDVLNAFPADVHMFHHASGTYRGRQGEILIPKALEGIITGIFGFDTRPKRKTPHRRRMVGSPGPGGANGVPSTTFATRYQFPTSAGGTKLDGTGECIGIIELGGGFSNSDLQIYFQELGQALPSVVAVSVDNAGNHPTKHGAADGEVMLDIEVAGAVAPAARQCVYFAPNTGTGFLDAVNFAVHDAERSPGVISISWGGPEDPSEQQAITAFHEVFVEAAALGVTVCAAAGDHGSADLDGFHWDGQIHVDHPAVDDYVLACGGTQIDAQGNDVVWNDGTSFSNSPGGGGWATGGGVSVTVPLPTYQKDAGVPVSLATGKPGRGVPDIAMSATDYFTRVQGLEGASGGTSAVAPLMASLVLLLNQAKRKRVGFLNPFLYANAAQGIVKDVTKGTNAIAGTVKGYKAGKGWDACTGLGTPIGKAILERL
ncbi:MAG TPA: S53 family serine peptidase [Gemmatimonadales bacterium]|nr:S53 family serine peptidase [Gemmatimonadales bacterium]